MRGRYPQLFPKLEDLWFQIAVVYLILVAFVFILFFSLSYGYRAYRTKKFTGKDCDWKGRLKKRFKLSKFRFEWGRWCYIIHPIEGGTHITWWEWEK